MSVDAFKSNSYAIIDTSFLRPTVSKGNVYAIIDLRVNIELYKSNAYAIIDLNGRQLFVPKKYPRFIVSNPVFINRR